MRGACIHYWVIVHVFYFAVLCGYFVYLNAFDDDNEVEKRTEEAGWTKKTNRNDEILTN